MKYEMSEKVKVSCLGRGTTNYYPLGVQGKSVVCGKCKRPLPEPGMVLEPILAGVADRRKGELMVIKMSLDRHPEMGASFGILGVPSFLVLQKGTERGRMSGALTEADFVLWFDKHI